MIVTAVILAAGFGSRLKEITSNKPKGFIQIEGISLIERSIHALLEAGIKRIIIGAGYLAEQYSSFAKNYPQITVVISENFSSTSSMETLFVLRGFIKEDFLLLESDILYEPRVIYHALMAVDTIIASGETLSNDEVFIQAGDEGYLEAVSKNSNKLKSIYAELVGISSISFSTYRKMCEIYEEQDNKKVDYEHILAKVSKSQPIKVKKIENLIWCEIDDAQHLRRAEQIIWPKIKANALYIKRNILLNPGPATTTDTVKFAQVVPDICPREKEFGDLMEFVSDELTSLVANPETHTTVLFGGSGTAAVEAILTSVVQRHKAVLIINNGSYGRRMCQIAERYNIVYMEFTSSPLLPIDLNALEQMIGKHKNSLTHLALVHHETTTGLLNNLDDIGKLAQQYSMELIVDAMSSYAAIPINMQKHNISYLAASSNKNLQAMAGVSFVISSQRKLKGLKNITPRTFYLSLYEQYKYFSETQQMRFTPPVQTLYALKQAILEVKEEDISSRYQRYSNSWKLLTEGLRRLELNYLVDDAYHSRIITSVCLPDNIDFFDLYNFFYQRDFTLYPGKVDEFNTFRVANIGEITQDDISMFIILLEEFLTVKGRGK